MGMDLSLIDEKQTSITRTLQKVSGIAEWISSPQPEETYSSFSQQLKF